MVYPRIHEPVLYEWELNETHSRYEYSRAQPSANTLRVEFTILATVNAFVAATVGFLIWAMLRSPQVRRNTFNLYIIFLVIPDFSIAFLCMITCALSASVSRFYSEAMCGFQSFYLNAAFQINAWLNATLCWQIYKMLRYSNTRRRYHPPTRQQVLCHVAMIYSYGLFWGLLCGFNLSFLPHSTHLYYGLACNPMEYDLASTIFFWFVYIPATWGIPIGYAFYVLVAIWRHNLMPPSGRRRKLVMFLIRLCCTYFAGWAPFLLLALVGNFIKINPIILLFAAILAHMQGFITAAFCMYGQGDIRQSAWLLATCQPASNELPLRVGVQSSLSRGPSVRTVTVTDSLRRTASRSLKSISLRRASTVSRPSWWDQNNKDPPSQEMDEGEAKEEDLDNSSAAAKIAKLSTLPSSSVLQQPQSLIMDLSTNGHSSFQHDAENGSPPDENNPTGCGDDEQYELHSSHVQEDIPATEIEGVMGWPNDEFDGRDGEGCGDEGESMVPHRELPSP